MHFSIIDYHTIKFQSCHGYLQRIYFFFRQLTIFIYFYFGFYSLSYQSITCHYRISFFLFETMINIPFLLRYFFAKKVLGIIPRLTTSYFVTQLSHIIIPLYSYLNPKPFLNITNVSLPANVIFHNSSWITSCYTYISLFKFSTNS